jgi:sec-independent protein translocase protein TatA
MGNLGMTEILLIVVALLLFFGPSKLPELGKSLGKGSRSSRRPPMPSPRKCPDQVHPIPMVS